MIEKQYQPTIVITTSGLVYNGIIKESDTTAIKMLIPSRLVVVPRNQIEEMHESKISIMPTELLKDLDEHEVRSLIAYLSCRSQAPMLATPENASAFFFFGLNLSNWHNEGAPWKVDRGEITAPAPESGQAAQVTSNLHLPGDFRLNLQFHVGRDGRGAVLIREVVRPDAMTAPRVEFAAGQPLALAGEEGERVPAGEEGPQEVKADSWNKLEIIVADKRLQVRLNNRNAATATELKTTTRREIVLEGSEVTGQEIRFRNLDMQLLPVRK